MSISEYERARLERIRVNEAQMKQLGLTQAADQFSKQMPKVRKSPEKMVRKRVDDDEDYDKGGSDDSESASSSGSEEDDESASSETEDELMEKEREKKRKHQQQKKRSGRITANSASNKQKTTRNGKVVYDGLPVVGGQVDFSAFTYKGKARITRGNTTKEPKLADSLAKTKKSAPSKTVGSKGREGRKRKKDSEEDETSEEEYDVEDDDSE